MPEPTVMIDSGMMRRDTGTDDLQVAYTVVVTLPGAANSDLCIDDLFVKAREALDRWRAQANQESDSKLN